jgi:hypothetical protein
LRRSFPESVTEEEIRKRIWSHLAWQRHTSGEPYYCTYCSKPVNRDKGEVILNFTPNRPERWYRAVCAFCMTGKNEPRDAGRES